MGWGDEILAAGQAQRHFDTTGVPSLIVDTHDRPRWHPIWQDNPVVLHPDEVVDVERDAYNRLLSAPNARPYIIYPFTAQSGWTFNRAFHARDHVARIYLTDAEKYRGIHVRHGGPFVLIEPWSKHANLRWPREHWHALVQAIRHAGYRVVQHTHNATDYVVDGTDTILTGNFREACGILNSASLYIRGESGMCHAAAALGIPQVTIWGACMDWDVLGGYPKQYGIVGDGDACGSYKPCTHCSLTMLNIDPLRVFVGVRHQLEKHGLR